MSNATPAIDRLIEVIKIQHSSTRWPTAVNITLALTQAVLAFLTWQTW